MVFNNVHGERVMPYWEYGYGEMLYSKFKDIIDLDMYSYGPAYCLSFSHEECNVREDAPHELRRVQLYSDYVFDPRKYYIVCSTVYCNDDCVQLDNADTNVSAIFVYDSEDEAVADWDTICNQYLGKRYRN